MIELLALPGWKTAETALSAWVDQLRGQGLEVVLNRESTGVSWIEVDAPRLRGYAVTAGRHVEAINFELDAADLAARRALELAAAALSWELHEDDDDSKDDDY